MASPTIFLRSMRDCPILLSFLLVTLLIATLFLAFNPRWETNDDVGMSMIAHGYGLAAYGSPLLISSNVLWGYLVRVIPSINGVLGYSLATVTVLLVFGWATLYFLLRLGTGYLLGLLVIALLLLRPTLFPQFTVNAGLLTVAAIIGWQVHVRLGGVGNLVTACLLAFCAYLIRGQEFLLVLGVALPFLPWRALREQRQMQVAFLLLGVAIASAAIFDRWSYSGPEWQYFTEMWPELVSIIDFRGGKYLAQHPEILSHHGYTQNDINLVSDWFFVDPQIADPKSLNAMLTELGSLSMRSGSIQSGLVAAQYMFTPGFLPLILSALILLLLKPSWSVALAWLLCLTALFTLGVLGRPGILRVYVPLTCLLLVAPLLAGKHSEIDRLWLVKLMLLVACIGNAYLLMPPALVFKKWEQQIEKEIHRLSTKPIVSWSSSFPFELAFPVLANDPGTRNIKFYGLDAYTHAPFSVASTEQQAGRGMIARLQTAAGISIVVSKKQLEMLRLYCKEHLMGQLQDRTTVLTEKFAVQQVRCELSR